MKRIECEEELQNFKKTVLGHCVMPIWLSFSMFIAAIETKSRFQGTTDMSNSRTNFMSLSFFYQFKNNSILLSVIWL